MMMMIKLTGHKLVTKNDSMNLHDIFHLFLNSKACKFCYYPHTAGEEPEGQRGKAACPKSDNQ